MYLYLYFYCTVAGPGEDVKLSLVVAKDSAGFSNVNYDYVDGQVKVS